MLLAGSNGGRNNNKRSGLDAIARYPLEGELCFGLWSTGWIDGFLSRTGVLVVGAGRGQP